MLSKFNRFYVDVLNSLRTYSTCSRLQVAAILVKDSRILSSGYNGVAKSAMECNKIFTRNPDGSFNFNERIPGQKIKVRQLSYEQYRKVHHEFADKFEIHAEMNCLGFALRNRDELPGLRSEKQHRHHWRTAVLDHESVSELLQADPDIWNQGSLLP